jgi:hypothetical protein
VDLRNARVRASCQFGRYHDIEVEDDVTAYLEYPDGMIAAFIASTREDSQNEVPMSGFSRTGQGRFSSPPVWEIKIPIEGHGLQHNGILTNFASAKLD